MVEYIIVSPEEVRGGGNIISPAKEASDYTGYLSSLTVATGESVNGLPATVYNLEVDNTVLGKFEIKSDGHLYFSIESDSDITFSINNNGHLIASGTGEREYHITNGHCVYGA